MSAYYRDLRYGRKAFLRSGSKDGLSVKTSLKTPRTHWYPNTINFILQAQSTKKISIFCVASTREIAAVVELKATNR